MTYYYGYVLLSCKYIWTERKKIKELTKQGCNMESDGERADFPEGWTSFLPHLRKPTYF